MNKKPRKPKSVARSPFDEVMGPEVFLDNRLNELLRYFREMVGVLRDIRDKMPNKPPPWKN